MINGHGHPTRGCSREARGASHCSHRTGTVSRVLQQTTWAILLAARDLALPLCRYHLPLSRLSSSLLDQEGISARKPAIRMLWVELSCFILCDTFETEFCCRLVAYGGGQERGGFAEMWSKHTQKENRENIKMTAC